MDYLAANHNFWQQNTDEHLKSDFYDLPAFLAGKTSLNHIELELLGDISGKELLHLQCHFGQDSLSLARMGAQVTGVDFSQKAIAAAQDFNQKMGLNAQFLCSNVYDAPLHLAHKFDVVFASYGTIGWLPDISLWAKTVSHFLKPNGLFVFAEFHPFVWMYSNDFLRIEYHYHNHSPIVEATQGSYANPSGSQTTTQITFNHSLSEVISALVNSGLELEVFKEYNYSPYNCFQKTKQIAPNKYIIEPFGEKIPLVYALKLRKKN